MDDERLAHLERARAAVDEIARISPELGAELQAIRAGDESHPALEGLLAELAGPDDVDVKLRRESISVKVGRPALLVLFDNPRMTSFPDVESEFWRALLIRHQDPLARAARAVGRIELRGHFDGPLPGTGCLVAPNVVATNFHVANKFARRLKDRLIFRLNPGNQRIEASIDFLEEAGNGGSETFRIVRILHLQEDEKPDLALLEVEPMEVQAQRGERTSLPEYLRLSPYPATEGQKVAVIGYPGTDSHVPDQDTVRRIFGTEPNKKRLSPGFIVGVKDDVIHHTCSTLAGSSGSPVVDLETGMMVGLHFDGEFLKHNDAVPAQAIVEQLERLGKLPDPPAEEPAVPDPSPSEAAAHRETVVAPSTARQRPRNSRTPRST